jgi:hypothetical protein
MAVIPGPARWMRFFPFVRYTNNQYKNNACLLEFEVSIFNIARLERRLRIWLQAREFKWGLVVNKWSDVKCSELTLFMSSDFILRLREVSYGEVLGDKSAMYITVTLYWRYLTVLWLFHLGVSCTVVVLTCLVMCGCFGNMCTCIYCVLYCLYCVFCIVSFMCFNYLLCLY